MKYEALSSVLSALAEPRSIQEIAAHVRIGDLDAAAALNVLFSRGLTRREKGRSSCRIHTHCPPERLFCEGLRRTGPVLFGLPVGLLEPQAQLLLFLGECGSASAPELAVTLGRPDNEVRTDLFTLRTMGRLEEVGGTWQLVTRIPDRTAEAIAEVLERRAKICEPKAK